MKSRAGLSTLNNLHILFTQLLSQLINLLGGSIGVNLRKSNILNAAPQPLGLC